MGAIVENLSWKWNWEWQWEWAEEMGNGTTDKFTADWQLFKIC